jgi:PadR family transcriptional regulator, regulatory protein PadR
MVRDALADRGAVDSSGEARIMGHVRHTAGIYFRATSRQSSSFNGRALLRSGYLCRLSTMGASREPRMTKQTLQVLGALISHAGKGVSGAEIAREIKLLSGTLYPLLVRLEQAHWVESNWECEDPHELGRPRRRLYRLTALGERSAKAAFQEIASAWTLIWQPS